jgi:hypothetical protein
MIAAGLLLVVVGALAKFGALSWFGRLPGDLRWEGDGAAVYVPFTSMLLVSGLLSLLSWLTSR